MKDGLLAGDRPGLRLRARSNPPAPPSSRRGSGPSVLTWKVGMKWGHFTELTPGINKLLCGYLAEVLATHLCAGPQVSLPPLGGTIALFSHPWPVELPGGKVPSQLGHCLRLPPPVRSWRNLRRLAPLTQMEAVTPLRSVVRLRGAEGCQSLSASVALGKRPGKGDY